MIALIITVVDFIIYYLTFCYQRGTLAIAREAKPNGTISEIGNIQAIYTPTWLGTIAILNYLLLAVSLFLLWRSSWWYPLVYLFIRFFLVGIFPTFEQHWKRMIIKRGIQPF